MRLPLKVHFDYYGRDQVIDADNRILVNIPYRPEDRKFVLAVVHKMNRDWRFRFFGRQPFVYTRDDWLYEKPVKA